MHWVGNLKQVYQYIPGTHKCWHLYLEIWKKLTLVALIIIIATNVSHIIIWLYLQELIRGIFCQISGFHCVVVEVLTVMGFYTALVGASQPVVCEDREDWSPQELYCLFVIFIIHNHSRQIGVLAYTGDCVLQWHDCYMSHIWMLVKSCKLNKAQFCTFYHCYVE